MKYIGHKKLNEASTHIIGANSHAMVSFMELKIPVKHPLGSARREKLSDCCTSP